MWRGTMSNMFLVEKPGPAASLPRGGMSVFVLGDLLANRSSFNTQRLTRDQRRADTTPDHLVLQLYRSGGFSGEMGGAPVRIARGQVSVCDLRRPLVVQALPSDTLGLTLPRSLLSAAVVDRLPTRLDPSRERFLAARIAGLHQRLPSMTAVALPDVTARLLAALQRLFDPSDAVDALEAPELDADLITLAEWLIAGLLADPDLSPAEIAERLNVSSATLYRAFAPLGGVMAYVWAMRLDAVRVALDQPAERLTLSRIAARHGFKTLAHLSRTFRARYGASPSEWRMTLAGHASTDRQTDLRRLDLAWRALSH